MPAGRVVAGDVGCEGVPLTVADKAGVCVITKLAVTVLEEIGEPLFAAACAELTIVPPASRSAWVTVYVPVQLIVLPAANVVDGQVTVILLSVTLNEFAVKALLLSTEKVYVITWFGSVAVSGETLIASTNGGVKTVAVALLDVIVVVLNLALATA